MRNIQFPFLIFKDIIKPLASDFAVGLCPMLPARVLATQVTRSMLNKPIVKNYHLRSRKGFKSFIFIIAITDPHFTRQKRHFQAEYYSQQSNMRRMRDLGLKKYPHQLLKRILFIKFVGQNKRIRTVRRCAPATPDTVRGSISSKVD